MRKEEDYVEILSLGIDKICEKDESLSALERNISQSIKKFCKSLDLQKTVASSHFGKAFQADKSLSFADAEDLLEDASEFHSEEAQEEYEKSIKHFKEALYLNDDNYSLHYGLARAYQACTKLESSKALSLLHYEKAIKKATKMGCDISNICFDRGKYLYEKANYKEAIESFDLLIEQKSNNPFFYILKANAHLKLWNQLRKTEAKNSEKNHQAAIANYRKSICKLSENQNGLSKENEAFIEKCLKHFIPVTQGSASDDRIQKVKNESIKVLLKLIETEEIRLNLKNQDEFMKIMRKEEDYVEILSLGIDKICEKDESLSALERDISQSIKKFYDSLPQPHITETASSKAAATGGSAALVSLGSTDSVGLAGEGELHWDAESFSSEDA